MSAIHKIRKEIIEKTAQWENYVIVGNCQSHDEYIKSVASIRTMKGFISEIDEAIKREAEGDDDE